MTPVLTILLTIAITNVAAHAGEPEAPHGWWTNREGDVTTCLEIKPDHRLKLTFQGRMDREPIVVEGEYRVTANKMTDHHVTLTVKKIWQKQLGKCRKEWITATLDETQQLGRTIKVDDALALTLHFGCVDAHPSVQLCSHGPGEKQVVCKQLHDPNGACKASSGPAIDGAKINAPASPSK